MDIFCLKSQFAQGSTFFLRKRAIEINCLNTEVDMVADTDFWIRMATINPILKKENIWQTDKIWSYSTVHPFQRNSIQAPFYLNRAKMGVLLFLNSNILIEEKAKKKNALRLINDAFEYYCSKGLNCQEIIKLHFQITQNNLQFKRKLKILLSGSKLIRGMIGYHSGASQSASEQNIEIKKWF